MKGGTDLSDKVRSIWRDLESRDSTKGLYNPYLFINIAAMVMLGELFRSQFGGRVIGIDEAVRAMNAGAFEGATDWRRRLKAKCKTKTEVVSDSMGIVFTDLEAMGVGMLLTAPPLNPVEVE